MSLLAIRRNDDPALHRAMQQRRRSETGLILGVLLVALACTIAGQQIARKDFSSLVTELGTFAAPITLFVWLGMRGVPSRGRSTLAMAFASVGAILVVDLTTKWQLYDSFLRNDLSGRPVMAFGLVFCVPSALLIGLAARHEPLQRYGLILRNWRRQVLGGLLLGAVCVLHFMVTLTFSNILQFSARPPLYLVWTFGFELMQSLGEEVLFRGLLFRMLIRDYDWDTWQSAGVSTLANVLFYIVKYQDPVALAGVAIYISIVSVCSCILFRRYGSILPGYLVNMSFSIAAIFRS